MGKKSSGVVRGWIRWGEFKRVESQGKAKSRPAIWDFGPSIGGKYLKSGLSRSRPMGGQFKTGTTFGRQGKGVERAPSNFLGDRRGGINSRVGGEIITRGK